MSDDLHSDRAGSGGAMVGKRSTNPGAGNKPGLLRSLLDDLTHVLTAYGCPERDTEQLVRAVAATHRPEAVTDILQATPPEPAAWTALIDGYLNQVGSRYLLTEEATPADGYTPDWSYTLCGGVECTSGSRTGWLFGPLNGRTLCIPAGSKVKAGEQLTDGIPDPHDLLRMFGPRHAVAAVGDRLTDLCPLDPEAAERMVQPLLTAAVEVVDEGWWPDGGTFELPKGSLCTLRRFRIENGRAISHALRGLPSSADPRLHALADIRDDAERADAFLKQKLYRIARDAGLSMGSGACRRVYLGCTDLARLLDQGGAIPADDPDFLTTVGRELSEVGRALGVEACGQDAYEALARAGLAPGVTPRSLRKLSPEQIAGLTSALADVLNVEVPSEHVRAALERISWHWS